MQDIFRRITAFMLDQYATVLIVLAVVTGSTYLVLIYDIQNQKGNSTRVKLSTEQGQVIHDINFLLSSKTHTIDEDQLRKSNGEIIKQITFLTDVHTSLSQGLRLVNKGQRKTYVKGTLSRDIRRVYYDGKNSIDSLMKTYVSSVRRIMKLPANELSLETGELNKLIYHVSPPLLESLNKASFLFQTESEAMLAQTEQKQNLMFMISMGSLFLVGMMLLQPMVKRLKESALKVMAEKAFADTVVKTAQALIIGLDASGKVVLFNQYAEENTGWGLDEVKGNEFFTRFLPEHDQDSFRNHFTDMMTGKIEFSDEFETQLIISTGDLVNIVWHSTILRDPKSKQPVMFLVTGLDITDRKLAEQSLQNTHAELEQISHRLQDEVNLAATLQQSILPSPDIELPGFQGQASLLTSSEVGGDYYDYYKVGGHKSILLVGDVSGHGVAAGTMVSAAKAGIYPLVHEGITSPGEILGSLNETMLATAQQSLLMTMACLSLDARTGKLTFANAGHVLPYIWRHQAEQWEMLESSGLPLGKSIDSDYLATSVELQMEVGDKLFLFTDAVVEEESPAGEAFGYDRLEEILEVSGDAEPEVLRENIMTALEAHCRSNEFTDDVTIVVVTHSDRVMQEAAVNEVSDIIRISEVFYRQGEHPIPRVSKEYVVFMAEHGYADLLTRFSQDGICRVLPRHNDFCKKIGWNHLLNQHHETPDDDLFALLPDQPVHRQFQLTHTEDKMFVMEEIQAWLSDQESIEHEHVEALIIILDEMAENSLFAAPRDGKGVAYYQKGEARELSEHEEVRIDIAVTKDRLGLMITDNWGTLTPGVFLQNIARAMNEGVESGTGGAGLYMMWRLSDYLQIRVHPQHRTQVSTLWDLTGSVDMDADTGFQFLYHSDFEAASLKRA